MSKKDWTDKLRERLADYQEPVDLDLWAGIESTLAHQETVAQADKIRHISLQKKDARLVSIQRWSAAAVAAVLLAIGGGYIYFHSGSSLDKKLAHEVKNTISGVADSKSTRLQAKMNLTESAGRLSAELEQTESVGLQQAEAIRHNVDQVGAASKSHAEQTLCIAQGSQLIAPSSATQTASSRSAQLLSQRPECPEETMTECRAGDDKLLYSSAMGNDIAEIQRDAKNKEKYHVRYDAMLFAENGIITSNSNSMFSGNMVASAPVINSGTFYDVASAPFVTLLKAASVEKAKHHAPLAMGMQVGVHISPRLTLSTGAVYTRASSEFSHNGGNTYDTQQVLHYIGVPLGVNYEVWGTKRLHTYVMGGGEVDFNVKNDTEVGGMKLEEGILKDRAQFSAKISAGLQYDVMPELGIYVEPGAKYYFYNGSDIDNTFKDKKLNFNFLFGLRWNIGK